MNATWKRVTLVVASLTVLAGVSYGFLEVRAGFSQDKARDALYKASLLYNDYKADASVEFFLESLGHNPEFTVARRMLAQALFFTGQNEESLAEFRTIPESGTFDPAVAVHIQNLSSVKMEPSLNWQFSRVFPQERGYRYNLPTFVMNLPNRNLQLLSSGSLSVGNILEINPNGNYVRNYRRISEKLGLPMASAVSGNHVWITDFSKDLIHRLALDKGYIVPGINETDPVGGPGNGDEKFRGPAGICERNGFLYIADSGNSRVVKYSSQGEWQFSFSAVEAGFSLRRPFGIACVGEEIWVSEPDASRISIFDEFGNFLRFYGEDFLRKPRHLSATDSLVIIADERTGVHLINRNTMERITWTGYQKDDTFVSFVRPYSGTVDAFGNMYVTDYGSSELIQFVPEQFLYTNLEVWVERIYNQGYPQVGLYVSVKDQLGNYLKDLTADNFEIIENDARISGIRDDFLRQYRDQTSWVVLLSRRKEMASYQETLPWLFDFFITNLREKDRIKVLIYNEDIREASPWTNSRLRILQAIRESAVGTNNPVTAEKDAAYLYQAIHELLPERGRRAMIWILEGHADISRSLDGYSLNRVENFARNNHIPLYVINFEHPDHRNPDVIQRLRELAAETGGKYYHGYSSLADIRTLLRTQPENRYVLSFQSSGDPSWKGQYMDVRVIAKFQGRLGSESTGYFIPK